MTIWFAVFVLKCKISNFSKNKKNPCIFLRLLSTDISRLAENFLHNSI